MAKMGRPKKDKTKKRISATVDENVYLKLRESENQSSIIEKLLKKFFKI